MLQHALVAVDLAEDWTYLRARIPRLYALGTERLTLVHVASPGFPVAAERTYREERRALLEDAMAFARDYGFIVDGDVRVGEPVLELDLAMEESGAGFLVAVSRPRGPLHDLVMGSAVLELARIAGRATWLETVVGDEPGRTGGGVLLATDGSPAVAGAEGVAVDLATRFGAGLAVWVRPRRWLGANQDDRGGQMEAHLEALKAGCPVLRTEIATGDPATEIRRIAQCEGSDLIVLGKRGHNPITGLLLGRTAERICHRAPASVLLIPHSQSI